uniref:DnaJ heat shock protein family (Hsp40) member C7 n=1 Tax=Equus asinus TaxID=9793 RepID=A0A8C4LP19_EQUAS
MAAAAGCDVVMAATEPELLHDEEAKREAESFKEQGNAYYAKKDYNEAYNYYTKAIDMCPKNASYYGNRAATLMMLGRFREALGDAQQSVRLDDSFVRGHLREGKCHLSLGNAMAACRSFQRALELDHKNAQAQQEFKNANAVIEYEKIAETDFEKRDFRKVVFCMDRALEFAPACHRFKILKAECLAMLGRYPEAQSVASYMDTEQYEEAVRDYEKVYQTEKTKEHKQLLKNAQLELKKSKRKDYYKILGVDKNASEDEIKKAYRKRALMHHPDRHSGASAEVQKEEEKKFKEVGEAFTILSDPKKKTRYDSGQDLDEEGMNMGDFDANNIFKAFFGGPGGFSFEASGPGNFFFQFG